MNARPSPAAQLPAPTATTVAEQIAQDTTACQALLQLMQAEREALQKRDADTLGNIIEQKAHFLEQLERSAVIRTQWAQQVQAADADSAWHQILHSLRQPELQQQWDALKALMVDCRQQNETNGKLLARSQHTFGRLLNIMRGQSEAPALYTAKGGRTGGNSSHNFGEA